jgi:transitional endoplasmic reticulum ATPase
MHTLSQRKPAVPTLYVKSASATYYINHVFALARQETPCLLVFEDIDTIVTPNTRAYFFNEVDGLENNNGILMVASTNYLDKLDPGLTKRPSRFDRKYLFPLPSEVCTVVICSRCKLTICKAERATYCQFWRTKIEKKPIDFPSKLCGAIAKITDGFSFAYMQEAFIASLLIMARGEKEDFEDASDDPDDKDKDLDDYELWRVIKQQIKVLRDDMDSSDDLQQASKNDQADGKHAWGEAVSSVVSDPIDRPNGDKAESPDVGASSPRDGTFPGQRLTPGQAMRALTKYPRLGEDWGV